MRDTVMIVGLDNISPGVSTSPAGVGGMRPYLLDMVRHLPIAMPWVRFKLFTPAWNNEFGDLPPNVEIVCCNLVAKARPLRVLYEQMVLPQIIRRNQVDVWIGMHNVIPLFLRCKTVLIIQSLQYFSQPGSYRVMRRLYLRLLTGLCARRADHVIALSEHAREQATAYLGAKEDSITVIYNRLPHLHLPQPNPRPIEREQPFILCVSALYRYKNFFRLIEALARVPQPLSSLHLVIVGGDTKELSRAELRKFAGETGLAHRVHCPGRVEPAELARYYQTATALVLPTLDETFGLPVLEAMHFGCPVITSNTGSVAELGKGAAVLVDPLSVDSIAEGIAKVVLDKALAEQIRERGLARTKEFSLERMIRGFQMLLDSVDAADRPYASAGAAK